MNIPSAELRARNLRTLAVLAGLFFLPLAVSFWMYYGTDWRPARLINHGELITPARSLPAAALPAAIEGVPAQTNVFRKKWSLVYVGDGSCDQVCRHALHVMRQTRLSLNNEMTRVARVFLVTAHCCDRDFLTREHAGLDVLDASGAAGAALLPAFPPEREHSLFIVDPLGNLMMTYDVRQNPKGLLDDLKKLLSLSHIG
jgi:cytochrome oxidase Cu insertion factor (SCO1/SenC/PrrC family)